MVMCRKLLLAMGVFGLALLPLAAQESDEPAKGRGRAFIGVGVEPISENAERPGLMVREVEPEGPAAKAGIKQGDILLKVGGKELKDFQNLVSMIAEHKPGDQVTLSVMRDGKT